MWYKTGLNDVVLNCKMKKKTGKKNQLVHPVQSCNV